MCGRYTLSTPVGTLADEFGIAGPLPELQPSYNVAPTQEVPAVLAGTGGEGRRLEMLRWGLIPSWADDPGIGARMINARSETVAEKPSFRRAFKERRCLIPGGRLLRVAKDERRQATLLPSDEERAPLRLRRALGELERGWE
jgi:putative SOS response-associated peptidase YedK